MKLLAVSLVATVVSGGLAIPGLSQLSGIPGFNGAVRLVEQGANAVGFGGEQRLIETGDNQRVWGRESEKLQLRRVSRTLTSSFILNSNVNRSCRLRYWIFPDDSNRRKERGSLM